MVTSDSKKPSFWDQVKQVFSAPQKAQASSPQPTPSAGYAPTPSNVAALGGSSYIPNAYSKPQPTYIPNAYSIGGKAAVPTQTNNIITGGGGGGQPQPTQQINTDQGGQVESPLEAPQIDYNSMFQPLYESLQKQEAAAQSGLEADIAGVEQSSASRKAGLKAEQESRLGQFGQQRQEATGQTESAIQAARRQAAEILQGIQARYGGTTGTGRFQSEILGSQATQNIATNQAALQNVLGKITQSENDLKSQVSRLIEDEDAKLEVQKRELRANLQTRLADISKERGALESEKARMRIQEMQNYQTYLQGVNQRNAETKSKILLQQQQAQNELDKLRAQKNEELKVLLTPANLSSLVSSGALTSQQAGQLPIGANITGKSLDELLGVKGVVGQQPEDTLSSALGI